ncbi:hypothetical protein [Flavihumibacter sp. ZG627]|uniref:hypothetical protein n=1 Tax=Flavihumibacter sp. ZG627 TaxID=1463156 RepID=UPI000580129D|nr:hypothetical protein [Flavihumibacter sp. ZG627]KIC89997.1 hypothetical protein HY58_13385 [Flavihumibacter sp. ZG627]
MYIDAILSETHTGACIMVFVRFGDGSTGDLLFDADGEPMDLSSPEAKAISNYYQKLFNEIQIHP